MGFGLGFRRCWGLGIKTSGCRAQDLGCIQGLGLSSQGGQAMFHLRGNEFDPA